MPPPKTISAERLYHGRIFDLIIEHVEYPPGNVQKREFITHPGGSVIIPLLENNEVLLVRQYRYPHKQFLLEAPAGKLELNEDPLDCARRELQEETGHVAEHFEKLPSVFTTPAICNEILHIYLASGLKKSGLGQHLDEGEQNLTVEQYPFHTVVEMITHGEIVDGKTIIGVLLVERILKSRSH
jgi:ADP-ribose pyrophosphatase